MRLKFVKQTAREKDMHSEREIQGDAGERGVSL